SPEKEDNHSKATKRYGRGNSKSRHKFTKDELKRLKQEFECTPYPDFTTKDELARQFQCEVSVIGNWFQNKRARSTPELKDKISAMRRTRRCQDYMHIGHQDTQPPQASGEPYGSHDSVVRSIGRRSVVDYQGAAGSESSFRPKDFTLPAVSEQYYMGDHPAVSEQYYMGDQLKTQETQHFTFSY
ncbi:homeobox protein ceh-37-like, partial [Mus pahari]|uniref:homeobox protein ceh-37-like n=1 Tax=Mus pahari TaxID=10093 RepID=UPI000A30C4CE